MRNLLREDAEARRVYVARRGSGGTERSSSDPCAPARGYIEVFDPIHPTVARSGRSGIGEHLA
jgi:hypothetical protein